MSSEQTLKRFVSLESAGLIGHLTRSFSFTDEPKFFHYSCLDSNNINEGSSSCDKDKNRAKIKALAECVERYCLDNPSNLLVKEKYNSLRHVDPTLFLNFRDLDMNGKKEKYLEKLLSSEFLWVQGKGVDGKNVMLPAQLVYINHVFNEPIIRPRISTGAAMHDSFNDAAISGIMENIERDSYMLTYYAKRKVPKIKLEGELKELENYFKRYRLELNVFETTTDLGVPSFMCVNVDKTGIGPAISVGLSAGLDTQKAIERSILESQQVRQWIRYKFVEDKIPKINSQEEIKEVHHRGYYWYPLERLKDLDFLLGNSFQKSSTDFSTPNKMNFKELTNFLETRGINTYSVDIGNEHTKKEGFEVVKILQPELHPLFLEEKFPCLYSKRIESYLGGNEINNIPHPFM